MIEFNQICIPPEPTPDPSQRLKLRDYRWTYNGIIDIPDTNLTLDSPTIRLKSIEFFPDTDVFVIYYYAIQGTQLHLRSRTITRYQEDIDNITDLHFLNEFRSGDMELIDGVYTTQYRFGKYEYTFTDDSPWMDFEENIIYDFLAPTYFRKRKIEEAKDAYGRYTYQTTASKRWKTFAINGPGWETKIDGFELGGGEYEIPPNPYVHIVKVEHDIINDKFFVWIRLRIYSEEDGCTTTWEYPVVWEGIHYWDQINAGKIFENRLFLGTHEFPPQPANGEGEDF